MIAFVLRPLRWVVAQLASLPAWFRWVFLTAIVVAELLLIEAYALFTAGTLGAAVREVALIEAVCLAFVLAKSITSPPASSPSPESSSPREEEEGPPLLGFRIEPAYTRQLAIASPTSIAIGCVFIALSLIAILSLKPFGLLVAIAGVALLYFGFQLRSVPTPHPPMPGGPEGYRLAISLLQQSTNVLERAHVFLGWVENTARSVAVLVHDRLSWAHWHILGPSGSMKTYRVAVSICSQFLAKRSSVVFINHKGSKARGGDAAFNILKAAAEMAGAKVLFFSIVPDRAGHILAMLQDPAFLKMSLQQQVRLLAEAFGIEHGEDFSRAYFGSVGAKLIRGLLSALKAFSRPFSFANLVAINADEAARKLISAGMVRRDLDNASHAINATENLAEDPRLNVTPDSPVNPSLLENAIIVGKPLATPHLIYLDLPALLDAAAVRLISRFFILLLVSEAMSWKGPRVGHVYVCVDECQEMIHRSALRLIAQAREFDIHFIWVHQTLSDLRRDGPDHTAAIVNNTAVKLVMAARDSDGREWLRTSGGQVIRELIANSHTQSISEFGATDSRGTQSREFVADRFDANETNRINSEADLAVFEASPMSGFTRFPQAITVELAHMMDEEEFRAFGRQPWPQADGVTCVLATDLPKPTMPPITPPREDDFEDPDDEPEPDPKPTPKPPTGRQRPPKQHTAEEIERASAKAEMLRTLAQDGRRNNEGHTPS